MSETVGNSPRRVLAQVDGEDSFRFAERVARRDDVSGEIVALLCNQRTDDNQMQARRRALESRVGGRTWLVVGPHTRDELLEALVRLASELPRAELRAGAVAPAASLGRAALSSVA